MRNPLAVPILAALLLAGVALPRPALADAKHWVCPPCGLPCDTTVFDHAGTCPQCGMALVEQGSAQAAPRATKKVAILVFTGVEIIDYTGPWEVFGAAGFDVYTVAATRAPVTTAMGMTVVPDHTFADAPAPDVLVVPGGGIGGALGSAPTLQWVAAESGRTPITMSVCNGAFILAKSGLLDGLTATTTYHNIPRLREQYPKTKVVDDQRFVDNGRIITTAGLTAGMDGALHVVSRVLGNGVAQQVALGEEYDWQPQAGFARGRLAAGNIPDFDLAAELDSPGPWDVVRTEGDTRHWTIELRGRSRLGREELLDHLGRALVAHASWRSEAAGAATAGTSRWRFTGRDGAEWTGTVSAEPAADTAHGYTLKVEVARAG